MRSRRLLVLGLGCLVAMLGCGEEPGVAMMDPVPAPTAGVAASPTIPGRTYITVGGQGVAALAGAPIGLTYLEADGHAMMQVCQAEPTRVSHAPRTLRFACGVGHPAAVPAGSMTITLENPIERTGTELHVAEVQVTDIEVGVVEPDPDGPITSSRGGCQIAESLGRGAGTAVLPNSVVLRFDGETCTPVARGHYVNKATLEVAGHLHPDRIKQVYAGKAEGPLVLVASFGQEAQTYFEFVTPATPAEGAFRVTVVNLPDDALDYDRWTLVRLSVNTAVGTIEGTPELVLSCDGNDRVGSANRVSCLVGDAAIVCAGDNLCAY